MKENNQKKPTTKQKILVVIAALFLLTAVASVFLSFMGIVSGMRYMLNICMAVATLCGGFALWPDKKPLAIVLFVVGALNGVIAAMTVVLG